MTRARLTIQYPQGAVPSEWWSDLRAALAFQTWVEYRIGVPAWVEYAG